MGLLYGIGLRLMNLMVFFLIVVLLPLGPPTTFPFKAFEVTPPKELKGALEPNHHVDGAERLLDQRVYGPECLIVRNNEIYTGIHGGEVIKLTAEHATHVVKLGQPCEDIFEESRCGRPLGLAFDTIENNLIIADAYYGLWQVDLKTHKKKLLVSPQQELAGKGVNRPAKIFNSVAVDQRGDIYWTDSSSDFTIQDLVFTSFANPSGRLFKYDRSKNVSSVLLDELNFANGLALSPDEDFIVIAETGAMRLTKYHLKGPKTGQSEVFVDGLPGLPDNLTPDADGIWVPLVVASDSDHPSGFSIFSNFPTLRLFFMRLLYVFEAPFKLLNTYYPNKLAQRFVHFIGHGESILLLNPKRATIVRVDWHGSIVGSLHGFDKSVGAVSHVLEHNDQLYLGSPFNRFLARVKSPRAAAAKQSGGVKIKNVRLFRYDRSKNVSTVLLDELFCANGIALSPDEDFIVVAETCAMRLIKYHLKGPRAGQSEIFVEGLPGHPDNLTPDADGIWVPLVIAADSENPSGFTIFSNFPTLRLFFSRLLYIFETPFKLLNTYYPNKLAQRFIYFIGHPDMMLLLTPKRSTIVRVDWHGSIVGSLHGFDKSVGTISHVLEHNDQLYLGSPFNRFLARVKSPRAVAPKQSGGVKITNVRYEGVSIEPIVTQPKDEPTTTSTTTTSTPKPKPTTTAKATTTATTTATPRKPTTTTTTPRPTTTARPTTTPKPATTTTAKPTPTTTKRVPPAKPAPVEEHIPADTKPPQKEKRKVIDKQGKHVEL